MNTQIHQPNDILIDRYRINSFIAEGGMQQVYNAFDFSLERNVALKTPKNNSATKRFKRSAILSSKINHPNLARTLDYFECNNTAYLIEELLTGVNLSDFFLENFAILDPHLAAHLLHHLAKGVAASHRVEVFHRDLKPSNIMVSSDPGLTTVKITDFGIAKLAEEEIVEGILGGNETITGSKTVLGALPYMAPEMIDAPRDASMPADIWAIGAIAYHAIIGSPPFGSGLSAVKRILTDDFPPLPFTPPHNKLQFKPLLTDLWEIVSRCLDKNLSERPTADELVVLCSRLCYSTAKREMGTIKNYNSGNGAWGFIKTMGGDAFFHGTSFYGQSLEQGDLVSLSVFEGYPKARAFPVLPKNK